MEALMLGETAPQPCYEAVSKALWEETVRACWRAQEGDPEDVTFINECKTSRTVPGTF